jgi:HK97 family phage portal protein
VRNPLRALFERRGIASSYDLLQYMLRGSSTNSGATVNESTSMNVAAVWTGIGIRATLLSTLPVDVIEVSDDGRTRTRRPRHPVARVLSKPNSWQTRSELFGMLEAHRVLRGNGYAWKNLAENPLTGFQDVRELIPMHPDQVEVVSGDDLEGPARYRLHKRNGQVVPLPPSEVVHLKWLSTDGKVGRGFMRDLRETIGGSLALQEHANSLWSRDATPSIALRHPKTLSEKARQGLEEAWESTYGRSKDKRRVAVLEEGMEISSSRSTP